MPNLTNTLSLKQRLDIALDVMEALDYLHNHCQTPIVHCDLKPSNILLTEDMSARVGDFGILLTQNRANTLECARTRERSSKRSKLAKPWADRSER